MGNSKSKSCSNKNSDEDQKLRLNDYDMTIYEYRKDKIFKGTIAVSIVYAFIALLIILGSYFSSSIKFIIFEKFLPFTIVFIIGTILLICYLYYNIINFNPIKINKNYDYTNISCPDYWKLEYNDELSKYFDSNSINTNIFNYRCVLDDNIFSKTDLFYNKKLQNNNDIKLNNDAIKISGNNNIDKNDYIGDLKNEIDKNNVNYLYSDIKSPTNKEIVRKIVGNYDNNVFKNLVESSLLMNNYVINPDSQSEDYLNYKYFQNASLSSDNINGNLLQDDIKTKLNLDLVNIDDTTKPLTKTDIIKIKKNINNENYLENIYINDTNTKITQIPLVCNRLYPLLMAAKDKELSKSSDGKYDENVLRCSYSKMCGIPWSDMNCDKYNV